MKEIPYNRTKIVCTIGPASDSEENLKRLILAGMDVARLNFSHGSHSKHKETLSIIRKLNDELGTHVAVLLDLQGPKIRVGNLEKPFPIKKGDRVFLDSSLDSRKDNVLPVQYDTFAADVNKGDLVLVDDGTVELRVIDTDKKCCVELEVFHGKSIKSKKGINLPFTRISLPSITEKDFEDLEFAIREDVDWIALSFVRHPRELKALRKILDERGSGARIIAKIEKPEALTNIDEIIAETDGIMVARGDLGVEIPLENVPSWQKIIVRKSNQAAKPVIVATQMMESMIQNRRPTRAEASDVANAVMDGADALMLSGETSVGKFPVQVVKSMQKIIRSVEEEGDIYHKNRKANHRSPTFLNDTLIITACQMAEEMDAEAIIGMTVSGYTAFQLSKCRPKSHIYIFTENRKLLNILSLVWGVRGFFYDRFVSTDETIEDVKNSLLENEYIEPGDLIINTGTMPLGERQRTNMIKFTQV